MFLLIQNLKRFIYLIFFLLSTTSLADNHNIYETLENIQKDIKTLERAVYSGAIETSNSNQTNLNLDSSTNSEVLMLGSPIKICNLSCNR